MTPAADANAVLVADCDTGEVIYQRNADKSVAPASTTKIITLRWNTPQHSSHPEQVFRYVVYRFAQNEKCDTGQASAILAVTSEPSYRIISDPTGRYTYVVTALDRFHNESKPSKKIKFDRDRKSVV